MFLSITGVVLVDVESQVLLWYFSVEWLTPILRFVNEIQQGFTKVGLYKIETAYRADLKLVN